MMGVAPIERDRRCDRCGHALYRHATAALGTICLVGHGRAPRAKSERLCACDGFVPEPK